MTSSMLLVSMSIALVGGLVCMLPAVRGEWINRLGGVTAAAAGGLAAVAAVTILVTGRASLLSIGWNMPFASFTLSIDSLSAFFILPISLICSLAGLYGIGYMRGNMNQGQNRMTWVCYLVLMASMLLVVSAGNGILFLLAWEFMSISSFVLVMHSHKQQEVRRAGWIYLTASHIGTAFLLVLFSLSGWNIGSMGFAAGGAHHAHSASLFFLLAFIGFGTKAGLVPMHVWLPEAHPAAPSHVSAVMSGVMIKTGVYGVLRTVTALGSPATWPLWWGPFLIAAGALSGIFGVLNALGQRDMKRLLAYSSVENMGIIFIGLGLWMLGAASGNQLVSVLGLAGAMLHVWNHSLIKSLLFMGAGAVGKSTGTMDIQRLGGLLRRMKVTGLTVFTGSAAMSSLPPLNGFVSEFLIYSAAFTALTSANSLLTTVSALSAAASMALTGGLALACFARSFSMVFLGTPRCARAETAGEVSPQMYVPMVLTALMCPALAILSPLMLSGYFSAEGMSSQASVIWRVVVSAALLPVSAILVSLLRKLLLRRRCSTKYETWACGFTGPATRAQYSASSFSWPVLLLFRNLLGLRESTSVPHGLFPAGMTALSGIRDVFNRFLYRPLFRGFLDLSNRVSGLQHGRNQLYILYMAVTLIVLLLWKLWGRQ